MSTFDEPKLEKLLTTKKLFAVFFIQLNEAYQLSVLLPMVVFMCRDFGISSKWLGVYTSILNASFGLCQFLVSYAWGYLSDIYGRRIILIIGIIGTLSAMILFGFSMSYEWAIMARCLTGFFNGNLGVVKAYLADITDSTNRGFAFSIIGVAFGGGIILGSMLGGILIETHDVEASDDDYIKTTSILKYGMFESDFPFLLPCLCGAFISGTALLCAFLFVRDERVNYDKLDYQSNDHYDISDDKAVSIMSSELEMTYTKSEIDFDTTKYVYDPSYHNSLPTPQEFSAMKTKFQPDKMQLLSRKKMENESNNNHREIVIDNTTDMFKHTMLPHSLFQYSLAAGSHMMFKEMGPVYMAQLLLFDSQFIGYTQAVGGVALFIFTLFMQPWFLKTFNHRYLCMYLGALGSTLVCLSMPSVYWFTFANDTILTTSWFLLIMVCLIESIFTGTFSICFVVSACYVNNSVPNSHIGKANGIGQTVAAFVRGVGPIITGFIWSESVTKIEDGDHWFVYFAYSPAAILYCVMCIHLWCKIPSDLQYTWELRAKQVTMTKQS
eukprot:152963_1